MNLSGYQIVSEAIDKPSKTKTVLKNTAKVAGGIGTGMLSAYLISRKAEDKFEKKLQDRKKGNFYLSKQDKNTIHIKYPSSIHRRIEKEVPKDFSGYTRTKMADKIYNKYGDRLIDKVNKLEQKNRHKSALKGLALGIGAYGAGLGALKYLKHRKSKRNIQ